MSESEEEPRVAIVAQTKADADAALQDMRARIEIECARELMYLRTYMRGIYEARKQYAEAYVTADDVAEQYDDAVRMGDLPPSESRTFLSQVFVTPGWKKTGAMVNSRRAKNRSRKVNCWMYVGDDT